MADYDSSWRSNYFKVKDLEEFTTELKEFFDGYVEVGECRDDPSLVGVFPNGGFSVGGIPVAYEAGPYKEDIYLQDAIAKHLVPGQVCILIEVGAEKLRYLIGYAIAFDSTGKTVDVSLQSIYSKALEAFGTTPTPAEY